MLMELGFTFLVPPKGHPRYTLTNIKKGTLHTLTKNSNINPGSYGLRASVFAVSALVRPKAQEKARLENSRGLPRTFSQP